MITDRRSTIRSEKHSTRRRCFKAVPYVKHNTSSTLKPSKVLISIIRVKIILKLRQPGALIGENTTLLGEDTATIFWWPAGDFGGGFDFSDDGAGLVAAKMRRVLIVLLVWLCSACVLTTGMYRCFLINCLRFNYFSCGRWCCLETRLFCFSGDKALRGGFELGSTGQCWSTCPLHFRLNI